MCSQLWKLSSRVLEQSKVRYACYVRISQVVTVILLAVQEYIGIERLVRAAATSTDRRGVQPRGESFPPRLTEETRISRHNQNHRQVVNNSCDVQYSTSTMEQDQKRLQELSEALQKFQDGV